MNDFQLPLPDIPTLHQYYRIMTHSQETSKEEDLPSVEFSQSLLDLVKRKKSISSFEMTVKLGDEF